MINGTGTGTPGYLRTVEMCAYDLASYADPQARSEML